jgi:hypothetical protein
MIINDAGLAGRDQLILSQHLTGHQLNHGDHLVGGGDGDRLPDQPARFRVAGRTEPDTRQPVDLPGRPGTQLEPQRRQWAEQRLLDGQLFGGIAPISECTVALISAHQAAANVLAVARSSKGC